MRLFAADLEQNQAAFNWALRIKRVSVYGSYYLVLTQSLKCDYWTADKRLVSALQNAHLGWLQWIEEMTL